jgi:hypothetical protein
MSAALLGVGVGTEGARMCSAAELFGGGAVHPPKHREINKAIKIFACKKPIIDGLQLKGMVPSFQFRLRKA